MNFFQRRKILRSTSLLDLVPVPLVSHEQNESGKVELLVPKFRNEKFARWFIPRRRTVHYRIKLDETGSRVWLQLDGVKTFETLLQQLTLPGETDFEERLGKFFTLMYDNGYITFKQLIETQNS